MSGEAENFVLTLFGDETCLNLKAFLAIVWAHRCIPVQIQEDMGKGVIRTFVVLHTAGSLFYLSGAIGTSTSELVEDQLLGLLKGFDNVHGISSGL